MLSRLKSLVYDFGYMLSPFFKSCIKKWAQHTSGVYTTTLDNSETLKEGQVYSECIIDGKTSIQAEPNQKVTISISETSKFVKFENVIYGSNKISGKFIMGN